MIIMEQLHETESLPMHVHYGTTAYHYVTTACVPGAVSAASPRYNEGGWIGATAQRKSRCKPQELKPRGLVLEFGGFAFVTEPIPHRELQLVGASLQ